MIRLGRSVLRFLGSVSAELHSPFALDAFGTDEPPSQQLVGFVIHTAPAALAVGAVIVGWRRPLTAREFCLGLGSLYVANAWGRAPQAGPAVEVGPIWITGVLFCADGAASADQLTCRSMIGVRDSTPSWDPALAAAAGIVSRQMPSSVDQGTRAAAGAP